MYTFHYGVAVWEQFPDLNPVASRHKFIFRSGISMKKMLLGAVALFAIGAAPALAADLPAAPVYTKAPPIVAPAYNWTGFYVGVNAGSGWTSSNSVNTTGSAGFCNAPVLGCVLVPNLSTTSAQLATFSSTLGGKGHFIGGAQIGYNYQFNLLVAGYEVDFQGLIPGSQSATSNGLVTNPNFLPSLYGQTAIVTRKLSGLGTVRGRLGFLFTPTFLGYVTGGLAFGNVGMSTNIDQNQVVFKPAPLVSGGAAVSEMHVGSVVGGGAEWMFAHNWSAKFEYLHYDLGTLSNTVSLVSTFGVPPSNIFSSSTATSITRFNGNILRAGVSLHL